jgi:hypothetical protein
MKSKRTLPTTRAFITLSMGAGLLFAQPGFAIGKPARNFSALKNIPGEGEPGKKGKTKSKSFSSRNNSIVKIYPDALKRIMHIVAKENAGKEIDFFVFDLEGTLLYNYKMKAKDHIKIEGLARGSYVYRVFSGDEETAAGNFEIR